MRALKEAQVEPCLQQVDLLDDGRRRDEERFRRLAEAPLLCRFHEGYQLWIVQSPAPLSFCSHILSAGVLPHSSQHVQEDFLNL